MRILDRYIIKSVLSVFIVCLATFVLLYIIIDLFSFLEEILKNKISILVLMKYYISYLPIIFLQVSPFCSLLATLYTFAKLNRNNEIIAMRASGISVFGIAKTVIVFGIIISALLFLINDRLVPTALLTNQKMKHSIENQPSKTNENETVRNLSIYGLRNSLFFINKFSPKTETMEGIIILEHDENQNITKKIVANKGVYRNGRWIFYQAITYFFDISGQIKNEPKYSEEEEMFIPETPHEFIAQRQLPAYMSIAQLNDYLWKLSKSGAATVIRNLKIDIYQRYTNALLCIIIIFLGIPFSLKIKKHAAGISSFGVSIIVAFLYYVLNAVSIALGKAGLIIPILSASLSHIAALSLSIYLLAKIP